MEPLTAAYGRVLDRMEPVRYRYKTEAEDAPFHLGYIAQDVETALAAEGIGGAAVVGRYTEEGGDTRLTLAYEEMIAMLHCKIRGLEAEIRQMREALK